MMVVVLEVVMLVLEVVVMLLVLVEVVLLMHRGGGLFLSHPELGRSLGRRFLPLYFFSLLTEPFSFGLLMSSELLEVEEESSTVNTRSGSGPAGVKMTALWCSFT